MRYTLQEAYTTTKGEKVKSIDYIKENLSPAIDAPAHSCYSKCDAALPQHTGCIYRFARPPAVECYSPFTPGGRHLFISHTNAPCHVSFSTAKLHSC